MGTWVTIMVNILVKNVLILTMNGSQQIIKDGAIAIENDRIVEIGKSNDLTRSYKAEKVLDASGRLVMPGVVCPTATPRAKHGVGCQRRTNLSSMRYCRLAGGLCLKTC
ncbi:hypothetical protein A3K70_01100 [Candidatus Bathyarchaeota archaeon RBG_16_48_13]|nr:MAG: hypothetical protein A3K70_01100 [Candidatus Bathyarchaeota archaeon RBG_16_48_13]